jgi:hypothetical protein
MASASSTIASNVGLVLPKQMVTTVPSTSTTQTRTVSPGVACPDPPATLKRLRFSVTLKLFLFTSTVEFSIHRTCFVHIQKSRSGSA